MITLCYMRFIPHIEHEKCGKLSPRIHYPKEAEPNWYIFLYNSHELLTDTWSHFCEDDVGLKFEFFWPLLFTQPCNDWHPFFQDLLLLSKIKFI